MWGCAEGKWFIGDLGHQSDVRLPRHRLGNHGSFSAGPGCDACTGLGSPIATQLIKLLAATGGASSRKAAPRTAGRHQAAKKAARKR
jgi:kumamolisin